MDLPKIIIVSLSLLLNLGLVVVIVGLIPAIISDLRKKKFHWILRWTILVLVLVALSIILNLYIASQDSNITNIKIPALKKFE